MSDGSGSSRTGVLTAVRNAVASLMQPLHREQAALRRETTRHFQESMGRAAYLENRINALTQSVLFSRWMQDTDAVLARSEVGHWLNWLGLGGEGVEVGVFRGEFSEIVLRTWECRRLTSVDPWREFGGDDYVDSCNQSQEKHDENFADAFQRLSIFGDRSRVMRETSAEAVSGFPDRSIDFVYLDAQHHYNAVKEDIALWFPKVRSGGVIGGHDYLDGKRPSGVYGVKRAVDEFISAHGYRAIITKEPNWPSWFVKIA